MSRGRGQARGGSGRAAARRRFQLAQERAARACRREALARAEAFRRGVLALRRLDWSRFGIGIKEAGDAMRRFLLAAEAALPECKVDGCKRRARGVLPGVGRVCAIHLMVGTGTKRPVGILDHARAAQLPANRAAFRAFAEQDRVQRQVDAILKPRPASGATISVQLHESSAAHTTVPAHLHARAHRDALRGLRQRP